MQITITGKHLDVGSALKEYVETDLNELVTKYFERAINADVVFTKENYLFSVVITVNEGTGGQDLIKANSQDAEIYNAYNLAAEKIRKRLRRYKTRVKDHHKERNNEKFQDAMHYVISHTETNQDEEEEIGQNPLIIAENQAILERLSVSDAVMRMDLGELPALMFINKLNDHVNMIYKREDGNIAWIDPHELKTTKKAKHA